MRQQHRRLGHYVIGAFLLVYSLILVGQLDHGLGSLDANGIVRTTRTLVDEQRIEVSRPPGHPTTELYLFGAIAHVMKSAFGKEFDATIYLLLQGAAAVIVLLIFYRLLLRLGFEQLFAGLATMCVGLSPQYFANAVDGEEFIFALFFVLMAVELLLHSDSQQPRLWRLLASVSCFALATGCRPESVFAALVYPIYLLQVGLTWKRVLTLTTALPLAIFVVWFPLIFTGIHQPYDSGLTWRQAILVGGYKLVFTSFGPFVFVLLLASWVIGLTRIKENLARPVAWRFVYLCSILLPAIFFVIFFRYATKPAYLLVTLPFLLILALTVSKRLIVAICLLSLLDAVVTIDIFRDRRLTSPFVTVGGWIRTIEQKPYYKRDYLRRLSQHCEGHDTIIIADAWQSDFEYQMEKGMEPLRKKELTGPSGTRVSGFVGLSDSCIMVPREAAYQTELLKAWHDRGYALEIEVGLYRRLFDRYAMTDEKQAGDSAPFSFFSSSARP